MRILQKIAMGLFLCTLLSCSGYENDGKAVYYKYWNEGSGSHKQKLEADPATFTTLRHSNYGKDDKNVYYQGTKIVGADAPSFEVIGEFWARDKNRGYYGEKPIKGSDGSSFRVINGYYTTDGKDYFYETEPLHVADPQHFRFVYGEGDFECWASDGKYYYYNYYKVPSDDYAHLTIYEKSGGISKDSHWAYYLGRKLNYNHQGEKVVDTIDIASFTVTGYIECHDKYGCLNVMWGRKNCELPTNAH